ncbi:MAG: glycoside hydrolase family 127 protein [Planctomycetia bacterium]|nr:glycoside hydrolase family 127 protein [Planctomycetia bacterium]
MKRRDFLKTAAVFSSLPFVGDLFAGFDPLRPGTLELVPSRAVQLKGTFGIASTAGLDRLTKPPFDVPFVLADVNFNQKRWFTNFSGDISGRFLEIGSSEIPWSKVLAEVEDEIVKYQKPEGYFGATTNWWGESDLTKDTGEANMMPILWGNGRLLLGLTAAWKASGKPATLAAAKKLGDFYVNIVKPRFCDPKRMAEYETVSPGYASAYVTCVYEGMEGLVQLYRATKEKKYLDCVCQMADFHEPFDVLPVRHSHGSLSAHEGLMMIYEETGDRKYLDRVEKRWNDAVSGGYVNVCGSILEKFWVTDDHRDEGCTESDWLRLNLLLWRSTGNDKYLDMAERLLYNGYLANQWSTGGFGHRFMGVDKKGAFSYKKYSQESLWCCSFHGPLGYYDFKRYLVVAKKGGIRLNFATDFEVPISVNGQAWKIRCRRAMLHTIAYIVNVEGPAGASISLEIRKPNWAREVRVHRNDGPLSDANRVDPTQPIPAGTELVVLYPTELRFEDRRMRPIPAPDTPQRLEEVAILDGPHVVLAAEGDGEKIADLVIQRVPVPSKDDPFGRGWEGGKYTCDPKQVTEFIDLHMNDTRGHAFLWNVEVK